MKVFILLVLSIGLCQASPLPDEVGCDDPEVFEAVARAIKALNEERSQGNKFALNVILHAYRIALIMRKLIHVSALKEMLAEESEKSVILNVDAAGLLIFSKTGPGKKFHVAYQVRETACPIDADEPWQNCDLLGISEGHDGNCTADIDTESQDFSSISQNCKINPGQENVERSVAKCLGCWHPIDPKSLEVLPIVRFTIRQFNNQSQHFALFEIGEINKVTRQVVNGWNYRLEYSVKETNCSKNEFPDLSPACRHLPEGREGSCTANAHVDNANTLVHAEQDCKVQVEEKVDPPVDECFGCVVPIATDSQELKESLEAAIHSFNAKNNNDFHFKIVAIGEATTQEKAKPPAHKCRGCRVPIATENPEQKKPLEAILKYLKYSKDVEVVAGTIYRFDMIIQKTNCSKAEVEKLNENCMAAEDDERLTCRGSVHVRSWESFISSEVNCQEHQNLELSLRLPPGFTPFRSPVHAKGPSAAEKFHPDPRGHHIDKNRQVFGHARGHRKGPKHGHKKPTESSSEEVTVLPPVQTPDQLPTSKPFVEQDVNGRGVHEEGVGFPDVSPTHSTSTDSSTFLDHLPDLPEPPKCPGTPWKSKRDPEPLDTSFNDFDLLDALQK